MTRPDVLPSAICTASAPRIGIFRGSIASLCATLSTLRRNPRGQLRMTRGRCGSLLLHRKRLALSTPCRSPGASQMSSALPPRTDVGLGRHWISFFTKHHDLYLLFLCYIEHGRFEWVGPYVERIQSGNCQPLPA